MKDSFLDIHLNQSSSDDTEQKKSFSDSSEKSSKKALDKQVGGDHYKDMPIQVVEFCQKNKLNTCESNIIKYACRHGRKNGEGGVKDVKKIIHYAELLLELDYANETQEEWTD